MPTRDDLRNVAIIAHVDHGKTTLVDGVVLLVDASEGPLPQTRFVLRKALAKRMPVILVVNKTDRSDARIAEVVDETYELFMELLEDNGLADEALEFPIVYSNGKTGQASLERPADGTSPDSPDLAPLVKTLLETIPAPTYDAEEPLRAQVTNLDASPYLGRLARDAVAVVLGRQVLGMPSGRLPVFAKDEVVIPPEPVERVTIDTPGEY